MELYPPHRRYEMNFLRFDAFVLTLKCSLRENNKVLIFIDVFHGIEDPFICIISQVKIFSLLFLKALSRTITIVGTSLLACAIIKG
jgi:hypothetical protein